MHQIYIGCDTHKSKHSICIMSETGKELKVFEIKNSEEGFKKAQKEAEKYPNRLWGLENSANYAKKFRHFLFQKGEILKEVNPVFTGQKRSKHTCKSKTDSIDALVIAKIVRDERDHLPDIQPDKEKEEIAALVKQREAIVKDCTRIKNRLHAKLVDLKSDYKEEIKSLNGIKNLNKAEEIAKNTSSTTGELALLDIEMIRLLQDQEKKYKKLLEEKVQKLEPLQNLESIKGVGPVRACTLYASIGKLQGFKNSDKLASYAGIAPIQVASGRYSRTCRNPGGRKELFNIIRDIARDWKRHTQKGAEYYQKKIKEGKSKSQAIRSLMRQVVKVLWSILKRNQPYISKEDASLLTAA